MPLYTTNKFGLTFEEWLWQAGFDVKKLAKNRSEELPRHYLAWKNNLNPTLYIGKTKVSVG